ncbi:hypothetical protein T484DRAFT_1823459, partial [Baffinella frigidus]
MDDPFGSPSQQASPSPFGIPKLALPARDDSDPFGDVNSDDTQKAPRNHDSHPFSQNGAGHRDMLSGVEPAVEDSVSTPAQASNPFGKSDFSVPSSYPSSCPPSGAAPMNELFGSDGGAAEPSSLFGAGGTPSGAPGATAYLDPFASPLDAAGGDSAAMASAAGEITPSALPSQPEESNGAQAGDPYASAMDAAPVDPFAAADAPTPQTSEGGGVSFGEVSFGGEDSKLRVEEMHARASEDPFAEMSPAPRTLKDLVESGPYAAAGKGGVGSVADADDFDTLSQTHSHSMAGATIGASSMGAMSTRDDASVNEAADEDEEKEDQWAPAASVEGDAALEPGATSMGEVVAGDAADVTPRVASEGGVVSFGEVSFWGAGMEVKADGVQARASEDPFAEMSSAPRTLKDLVESEQASSGAKGGGSVEDNSDTISHSHSMAGATIGASSMGGRSVGDMSVQDDGSVHEAADIEEEGDAQVAAGDAASISETFGGVSPAVEEGGNGSTFASALSASSPMGSAFSAQASPFGANEPAAEDPSFGGAGAEAAAADAMGGGGEEGAAADPYGMAAAPADAYDFGGPASTTAAGSDAYDFGAPACATADSSGPYDFGAPGSGATAGSDPYDFGGPASAPATATDTTSISDAFGAPAAVAEPYDFGGPASAPATVSNGTSISDAFGTAAPAAADSSDPYDFGASAAPGGASSMGGGFATGPSGGGGGSMDDFFGSGAAGSGSTPVTNSFAAAAPTAGDPYDFGAPASSAAAASDNSISDAFGPAAPAGGDAGIESAFGMGASSSLEGAFASHKSPASSDPFGGCGLNGFGGAATASSGFGDIGDIGDMFGAVAAKSLVPASDSLAGFDTPGTLPAKPALPEKPAIFAIDILAPSNKPAKPEVEEDEWGERDDGVEKKIMVTIRSAAEIAARDAAEMSKAGNGFGLGLAPPVSTGRKRGVRGAVPGAAGSPMVLSREGSRERA